jgi:phage/plasmid-like protein (TIGR03299 family)
MSALLDSMFWVAEDGEPWHKEGTRIEYRVTTGKEAQKLAGCEWGVELRPLYFQSSLSISRQAADGSQYEERQLVETDQCAVIRTDTEGYLATVGRKFEPLQNDEFFSLMDEIVGQEEADYRTAGSLKGGRVVWVLASLPGYLKVGKDDHIAQFLLASNAHDGSQSYRINPTTVRVVCNNTLTMANSIADQTEANGGVSVQRFWHTSGLQKRAWDYAKAMAQIRVLFKKSEEVYQELAQCEVNQEDVDNFLEDVFPIPEDAKRPTRMLNMRESVLHKFEGAGLGSDLITARGTAWGLYNALAEFVDHDRGNSVDQRQYNSWFGTGASMKERGFIHVANWL